MIQIVFLILALVSFVNVLIELTKMFHNSNEQFVDNCPEKEVIAVDTDTVDRIMNCQSSCQMEAINRHRHNNWMRANLTAPNCGRKPRYKDHSRKAGLKAKEALAIWN